MSQRELPGIPASPRPQHLSPAMKALTAAIMAGKDEAGRTVYGPEEALALAKAQRSLMREEISVALGKAIQGMQDRPGSD